MNPSGPTALTCSSFFTFASVGLTQSLISKMEKKRFFQVWAFLEPQLCHLSVFFFFFFLIAVYLTCRVVLVSGIRCADSIVYVAG